MLGSLFIVPPARLDSGKGVSVQDGSVAEELYRVTLAFEAVENYVLPVPFDVPPALHVERDGTDYLAIVEVHAFSASEALAEGERTIRDLLACFAVRAASYLIVHDARRNVQLVNPEPAADGPVPPFQSVGGAVTDAGAEFLDPTGNLRRQRRIVNQFASATVTIGDISTQAQWFSQRHQWNKRLRRAMTVLHAAECAQVAEVRFVLLYFAFEILSSQKDRTLLRVRTPDKHERDTFQADLVTYFEGKGHSTSDAERWVRSVVNTHAESPIDAAFLYVTDAGETITLPELKWLRDQRGAYAHDGDFDRSPEASSRREEFRQLVRALIQRELDAFAQSAG
jgi:hypothetical protein